MAWMDCFWDDDAALLAIGPDLAVAPRNVRITIRYALGLMLRDAPGDTARACRALDAVLPQQYDEPGSALHGAFRSWAGQPHPGPAPTIFKFDPNHRQFAGTLFAVLLDEYASRLPEELVQRMDLAIHRMVEGEPLDRCLPVYSNIALMQAALLTWAGDRYGRPEWLRRGEVLGRDIHRLFGDENAFEEYNSPTYYGTDLFALALWQRHSRSDMLATWGAEIEAALWRDAAPYYHAGLKNFCGPFTRSYGMDMTAYCALLGMYVWLGVGRQAAPFPPATKEVFDHCNDFSWGPCIAMLDSPIPPDVLPHFTAFSAERLIKKRISHKPDRVATAWLSDTVMIGAEATPLDAGEMTFYRLREDFPEFNPASHHWRDPHAAAKRCAELSRDFCPATIYWRQPDGRPGWMRLQHLGAIHATASEGRLHVAGIFEAKLAARYGDAHRSFVFRIGVPANDVVIEPNRWHLPGLTLRVDGNLGQPIVQPDGKYVSVTYRPDIPRPEINFEVR